VCPQSYDEITVTPLTIRQFQTAVVVDVDAKVLVDDAEVKDVSECGGLALRAREGRPLGRCPSPASGLPVSRS